jgi:hypothetical protein
MAVEYGSQILSSGNACMMLRILFDNRTASFGQSPTFEALQRNMRYLLLRHCAQPPTDSPHMSGQQIYANV